jgi:hypothetical protein
MNAEGTKKFNAWAICPKERNPRRLRPIVKTKSETYSILSHCCIGRHSLSKVNPEKVIVLGFMGQSFVVEYKIALAIAQSVPYRKVGGSAQAVAFDPIGKTCPIYITSHATIYAVGIC